MKVCEAIGVEKRQLRRNNYYAYMSQRISLSKSVKGRKSSVVDLCLLPEPPAQAQ